MNDYMGEHRLTVDGYPVTLSREEAIAFLTTCKVLTGPILPAHVYVFYNDDWLRLARTDLKDDVCTTQDGYSVEDAIKTCNFGARVSNKTFAIIDSWSDG